MTTPRGSSLSTQSRVLCESFDTTGVFEPVILAEEDWAKWLGEEPATPEELKALLVPFKDDALTMWPVNRQRIGNVRNKDRDVALPEVLA
jgi:putative SOS response-associated peptidase YedK